MYLVKIKLKIKQIHFSMRGSCFEFIYKPIFSLYAVPDPDVF